MQSGQVSSGIVEERCLTIEIGSDEAVVTSNDGYVCDQGLNGEFESRYKVKAVDLRVRSVETHSIFGKLIYLHDG